MATSEGPASKTVWCMKWFFMLFPKTTQFTFQTTTVTDTVFELSVMFRCIHWPPVFIQKSQRKAARWNTSLPLIKLLPWVWTLLKTFGIMSTRLVKLFLRHFTVEMSAIVLLASPFFNFCTFCLSTLTILFFRSLLGFSLNVFFRGFKQSEWILFCKTMKSLQWTLKLSAMGLCLPSSVKLLRPLFLFSFFTALCQCLVYFRGWIRTPLLHSLCGTHPFFY